MNITTLGWALVHFVWQGAVIALVAAIALRLLRNSSPQARYLTSCITLLTMAAAPAATFAWLTASDLAYPSLIDLGSGGGVAASAQQDWISSIRDTLEPQLPGMVFLWFAGAFALFARAAGGWYLAWRLTRVCVSPAPEWLRRRATRVLISTRATVPQVFGWLRPVILIPASALINLTPDQLQMVLAHELAHVVRRDYLVNLLQTAVESLLFYHPAVWWISGRIRQEREHCCDDAALRACGDSVEYSRALLALEEARPEFAMAATGSSLKHRVARLLGTPAHGTPSNPAPAVAAIVLVAAGILAASPQAPPPPPPPPVPATEATAPQPPAAPVRVRKSKPATEVPPAPPPPPPPAVKRARYYSDLSPAERNRIETEVKASLDKARAEIERQKPLINAEIKRALEQARIEVEQSRPQMEADIRRALAEVKSIDAQAISAEIKRAVEQSLRAVDAGKIAQDAVAQAMQEVQRSLSDVDREIAQALNEARSEIAREVQYQSGSGTEAERRVRYADERFKEAGKRGSETDRGRAYVQNGPPDMIERNGNLEVWRYMDSAKKNAVKTIEFDAQGRRK